MEIHGLNGQQMSIANILWELNDQKSVDAFVKSLPTSAKRDATVVIEMMIATAMDENMSTDHAAQLLLRFRK